MDLRMYPMDIQECPLIIESCEYNVYTNTTVEIAYLLIFLLILFLERTLHECRILKKYMFSWHAQLQNVVHHKAVMKAEIKLIFVKILLIVFSVQCFRCHFCL